MSCGQSVLPWPSIGMRVTRSWINFPFLDDLFLLHWIPEIAELSWSFLCNRILLFELWLHSEVHKILFWGNSLFLGSLFRRVGYPASPTDSQSCRGHLSGHLPCPRHLPASWGDSVQRRHWSYETKGTQPTFHPDQRDCGGPRDVFLQSFLGHREAYTLCNLCWHAAAGCRWVDVLRLVVVADHMLKERPDFLGNALIFLENNKMRRLIYMYFYIWYILYVYILFFLSRYSHSQIKGALDPVQTVQI